MQYWLFKSEPDTWGWHNQTARGQKGEEWDGVPSPGIWLGFKQPILHLIKPLLFMT